MCVCNSCRLSAYVHNCILQLCSDDGLRLIHGMFLVEPQKKKKKIKTPQLDFLKMSLPELLVRLVNQTLCLISAWLAGWLQRGPMRNNRRKESLHTHTPTVPSFKQLQMVLIPRPRSFTIYQVTCSERAALFAANARQ